MEAGSYAEAMRLCEKFADIFGVVQAGFMGSKVSRTVEICVSKFPQMAESPKTVVVESENVTTPQEAARAPLPDVETIPEGIPEVPPARVGESYAPSSPMTPEEKGEERLDGDVVVKEHTKKKPRLHYEVSGLSDRVEKACESMMA